MPCSTNLLFLQQLLTHPLFVAGTFDTHFIATHVPPGIGSSGLLEPPIEILIAGKVFCLRFRALRVPAAQIGIRVRRRRVTGVCRCLSRRFGSTTWSAGGSPYLTRPPLCSAALRL